MMGTLHILIVLVVHPLLILPITHLEFLLIHHSWYLTDDARIAITGGDQCLDEGDNGIQTYQCTTGNTNQIFNTPYRSKFVGGGSGPTTTTGDVVYPSSTAIPSPEPDPCYGSGGDIVSTTINGTPTYTVVISTPSCAANQ